MTTEMYQKPQGWNSVKGTSINCEDGHCWHEWTVVGSLQCCRCGQYRYPDIVNYDNRIQEERLHKIPNIRAVREDK